MDPHTPIAIVSYAYRVPNAGRKGLWQFLTEARSAFSRVPSDRFDQDAWYSPNPEKAGTSSVEGAHFVPGDIYAFDAPFFNMSKAEASSLDPQLRMLLECAFEATEDAGMSIADLKGSNTGVFAVAERSEYREGMASDLPTTTKYTAPGTSSCMFANRLSYFFDLQGPSIAVDAACSSSAYAVHLACQSLRLGECDATIVGGASLMINQNWMVYLDTMGNAPTRPEHRELALSPDGKSFSYDSRANGFGLGEGAAALVLKRLDDALDSGDSIRAVIRNTCANHSGRTRGITLPSQAAQEMLIKAVHESVGLDPSATTFVEGHGTGTAVGDPMDAGAIANVVAKNRSEPVIIGSVKSNFGHLLGVSGMVATIKAVMMIENSTILPNANFEELNPQIDSGRVRVATAPMAWPKGALKRVCVTNFGFGGSNAAILLDDFHIASRPSTADGRVTNGPHLSNGDPPIKSHPAGPVCSTHQLFPFSARSDKSLRSYLSVFAEYLNASSPTPSVSFLHDLCYTLGQRRTHHSHRIALAADSVESLHNAITAASTSAKFELSKEPCVGFVFTGQGAQYARMAIDLYPYEPFMAALKRADLCIQDLGASWSLIDELEKYEPHSRVNDADLSQPACTAVQLALVSLLRAANVTPNVVTGHSSGEIAAAYTAGLLTFESAIAVAYHRGQAVQVLSRQATKVQGTMLALGVDEETAVALIERARGLGCAVVAAINSDQSVTISGDTSAIAEVERVAQEQGLFARRLKVSVAYHSPHMKLVSATYQAAIAPYLPGQESGSVEVVNDDDDDTEIAFVSSVTGQMERSKVASASYWTQNLMKPVRFLDATVAMCDEAVDILLEIGPHAALKGPITRTLSAYQAAAKATYLPSLVRGTDADTAFLALAARLYSKGSNVDFGEINKRPGRQARLLIDLPAYEWNKEQRYKHESRIALHGAHPGYPYSSLLGWKGSSGAGHEHKFRQIITVDEIPWLPDHKVAGDVLFPFTGFLSMAVDAFRAINRATPPSHISVKELFITTALRIDSERSADVTVTLRPAATGTRAFSSSRWTVEIASWSAAVGWVTHCHGQIEASTTELTVQSPGVRAAQAMIQSASPTTEAAEENYDIIEESGVSFGPAFKRMTKMFLDSAAGCAVHETELREIRESLSALSQSPVTVDAPTLDAFLHSTGAVSEGRRRPKAAYVPTYVSHLRVSNNIVATKGDRFVSVTQKTTEDPKSGRLAVNIIVFDASQHPCMELDMTVERVNDPVDQIRRSDQPEGYVESLVPFVESVSGSSLAKALTDYASDEEEQHHRRRLDQVAVHYLAQAVEATKNDKDLLDLPFHLWEFLKWARAHVASRGAHAILAPHDAESLIAKVSTVDAAGELVCAVGANLVPIVRGTIEPLELMLKDNLLQRYYEADRPTVRGCQALARYVSCLAESRPGMTILEIGGGTGSATLPILEALTEHGDTCAPKFARYVFTDISTGFFDATRKKLSRWPEITYQRLDISQNPAEQGFTMGDFDLVIATNVLHATQDLGETMENVRSLLKPGTGKLGMLEIVHGDRPTDLPFTVLPGWWLAEDEYRLAGNGPLLSPDDWHGLLTDSGFSGIDGMIQDLPDSADWRTGAIWSTSVASHSTALQETARCFSIYGPLAADANMQFSHRVSDAITAHVQWSSTVRELCRLEAAENQLCIIVDDPHHSIVTDLTETNFEKLKLLLLRCAGLLWVSLAGAGPESARMKGILRCLRQEDASKPYLWLEGLPGDASGALQVANLAERLLSFSPVEFREQEFVWRDGMIHVPRLHRSGKYTDTFAIEAGIPAKKTQRLGDERSSDTLQLTMSSPGHLDSLYFQRWNLGNSEDLKDDEIMVAVGAAGVNFRDLIVLLGRIPWGSLGGEGAGVVIKTGKNVRHVQAGDRVFYLIQEDGFASRVRLRASRAHKAPPGLSNVEVASMPAAYTTAIVCLMRVAQLEPGERVLIHAATGAVGQACIKIAQHIGAEIFATAGSPEKREFVHKTFAIPMSHIFSSRTAGFGEAIMTLTEGKGVDVVVNSLSGNLLQETWATVADFGRFIEIGKADLVDNSNLGMRNFNRNVSFCGVMIDQYHRKHPKIIQECFAQIVELTNQGVIGPIQGISALRASDALTGFRRLQSGTNIGKIVITFDPDDEVLAECRSPLEPGGPLLRSDATYVVTGGTGGIGRSLVSWFLDNGASHVVLLGRSANSNPHVAELLEQYARRAGVCVRAVACDVSSRQSLREALAAISDLPPVRGVIHGALHVRDAMFVNTSFQDWENINAPKISAAWHLHELLPKLDFFVALASGSALLGIAGQSIYAGTSTFLEAFADYRNSLGLHSVTISLPIVEEVGFVAEREGMREQLRETVRVSLSIAQVHSLIKGAIIGSKSGLNSNGRSFAFVRDDDSREVWRETSNYLLALESRGKAARSGTVDADRGASVDIQSVEDVLTLLGDKVSSITMIDRDEVTPDRKLMDYGLDSLVSVELRNWIRRTFDVQLALTQIINVENLRSLANQIFAREGN